MSEFRLDDVNEIDSEEKLRRLYPGTRYLAVLDELDRTCIKFIEHSPFVVLGAYNPDIGIEVSPRGDEPGFVKVLDSKTLLIPDRTGNNRLDCMTAFMKHKEIGLFFMIPGLLESVRVKGEVTVTDDRQLISLFPERNGKPPRSIIIIKVYEAFIHCGKAFKLSNFWDSGRNLSQESWKLMRGTLENSHFSDVELAGEL
jgi:uncharacterized protein